ncbi:SEC-C metal-binding domain-containing protein [Thiorhodovibrio winogradskyi]|nr:SEC-C metal-binding domain-containing protein [Thiorhodovibrio winogradskyi]
MMVGFLKILPYGEIKQLKIDDRLFYLSDHYCVKADCSCTDALVDCMEIIGTRDTEDSIINGPAVFLDYRKKTARIENAADADQHLLDEIIAALKAKSFTNFFSARHARLKALYRDYLRRNFSRTGRNDAHQSVGRNDPCPCGSGKKYKKCCLDKPAASERSALRSNQNPNAQQRSENSPAELRRLDPARRGLLGHSLWQGVCVTRQPTGARVGRASR